MARFLASSPSVLSPCSFARLRHASRLVHGIYVELSRSRPHTSPNHRAWFPHRRHLHAGGVVCGATTTNLRDTLTPVQQDQASKFMDLLLEWNEKMNLTAVKYASPPV